LHIIHSNAKIPKAYLVYHDIDFPYTHDIQKLLNLCGSQKWIEKIKSAEEITPYAISARYPGMDEPVTEDEANHAMDIASNVKKAIRKVLADDGMTIEGNTII